MDMKQMRGLLQFVKKSIFNLFKFFMHLVNFHIEVTVRISIFFGYVVDKILINIYSTFYEDIPRSKPRAAIRMSLF